MFYDFEKDLNFGEKGEDIIEKWLNKNGYHTKRNKDYKYDILCTKNNKSYRLEIKTDNFSYTGNIIFEYYSRNKLSGISTTQADFIITLFHDIKQLWIIKTENLKLLINHLKNSYTNGIIDDSTFTIKSGGDNQTSRLYVLNRKRLEYYFHIIKL